MAEHTSRQILDFSPAAPSYDDITRAVRDDLSLLTVDQVAQLLQVKRDWIYDQAQAGRFPVVKLGRQSRFRSADVAAYLNGTWQPPRPQGHAEAVRRRRPGRPRKS